MEQTCTRIGRQFVFAPSNPEVLAANKDKFPEMETFRANDVFGSWDDIMKKFFKDGGVFDEVNKK